MSEVLRAGLPLLLLVLLTPVATAQLPAPMPTEPSGPRLDLEPRLSAEELRKLPPLLGTQLTSEERDTPLIKLQKERLYAAVVEAQGLQQIWEAVGEGFPGQGLGMSLEMLREANARVLKSQLELCQTSDERVGLLAEQVEFAKSVEKRVRANVETGRSRPEPLYRARYYRLDAEIQLLREQEAAKTAKPRGR